MANPTLDTSSATAADEAWELSSAWLPESGDWADVVSSVACVKALNDLFLVRLSFHMLGFDYWCD